MIANNHTEDKLKVLVADDIQSGRLELMQIVRDLGHEPIEATNGQDALLLIESQHPDVLLLDLLMPEMDGFEVARIVRQRVTGKWLPVIVLSALQGEDHFAHALANGAADYLSKPVNVTILRAKLRQYQRILAVQAKLALMVKRQLTIHEHITDAIITIDSEGRISDLNRAARAVLALEEGTEATGRSLATLTGLSLADLMEKHEITIEGPNQKRVPFAVSYSSWSMGHKEFCTFALHDLSESRRIERMKDEFLATVSHELRTPLTSILGAMGLLAAGAGGALPEASIELLQVAKRNGDRLSQLIDDVLDLTKLEGDRMQLNMRPVELEPLIRESLIANEGYARRLSVHMAFDEHAQGCRANLDPDRFLQVMANLLSNAIKHSPKGETVRVRLTLSQQQAQVTVLDEGPGIDAAFKKKLFEKFSQADSTDRRPVGGTGLGLYISRMLVEKMGGTIAADSGATGGSAFRINLPCIDSSPVGPWILCIAQDHQLLKRMTDWLAGLANVEAVNNLAGAEALMHRRGLPNVLLANPQAQGPAEEFCAQLQTMLASKRIILMSDSLNTAFAERYKMGWLPVGSLPRQVIIDKVSAVMAKI